MTPRSSRLLLAVLAGILGAPITTTAQEYGGERRMTTTTVPLAFEGELPSLSGATGWLNSEPLTPAGLRGKVVLIDFWTYTCINWLRTLPYLRAWAEKYRDQGLVVIGVHSPEFPFEKDLDNVRRATREMALGFPIALDSDFAVWRAFDNQYWPALYFVDGEGRIRHHQFGEGGYEESERVIQQLLAEAGHKDVMGDLVAIEGRGVEAAADWASLRSPEYLGASRTEHFASPGGAVIGRSHSYSAPAPLRLNHWALAGDWQVGARAVLLQRPGGRIVYRFHARDLHLVMGPAAKGTTVRFRVLLDGLPPGEAHGLDTNADGYGTVSDQRMYQLIRQRPPIGAHSFDIEFLDAGVEAFAFTFG